MVKISSLDFMKNYRERTKELFLESEVTPASLEIISSSILMDLNSIKDEYMYSEAVNWGSVINFLVSAIGKLISILKSLYVILQKFFGEKTGNERKGDGQVPIPNKVINIVNNYYTAGMKNSTTTMNELKQSAESNNGLHEDKILSEVSFDAKKSILDMYKQMNTDILSRVDELEDTLANFRIPASFENRETMNKLLSYVNRFSAVFEEVNELVGEEVDNKCDKFYDILIKRVTMSQLFKLTEKIYDDILYCDLPILRKVSFNEVPNGYYLALQNPMTISLDTIKYIDEQNRIRRSTAQNIVNSLCDLRREKIQSENDFYNVEKLNLSDIYERMSGYLKSSNLDFIEVFKNDASNIKMTITELEKAKIKLTVMKKLSGEDAKEFIDACMGLITVTLSFTSLYTVIATQEKAIVSDLAVWEASLYKNFLKSASSVANDVYRENKPNDNPAMKVRD